MRLLVVAAGVLGLAVNLSGWGATDASLADAEYGSASFTASTLPAITPTITTTATTATVSWTASANSAVTYRLSRATDAGGSNATTVAGTASPVTDTGGSAPTAVTAYATAVSEGANHTCDIADGAVHCWGANDSGQVGNGTTTGPVTSPATVSLPGTPSAVSAGVSHSCAIVSGNLYCWGSNGSGELGLGSMTAPVTTATWVAALSGVTAVAAGNAFTCALASGVLYCWGLNTSGQLGIGTTTSVAAPAPVAGLTGLVVTALDAGDGADACAVAGGVPYCWGANDHGQLGNGTTTASGVPVAVSLGGALVGIAAERLVGVGASHACASGTTGVYCWGADAHGQLGDNDTTLTDSSVPVLVSGTGTWVATTLDAGGNRTCVSGITETGQGTRCWGAAANGGLGAGAAGTADTVRPVVVDGVGAYPALGIATSLSVGVNATCGAVAGATYCWGSNATGQLGAGATGSDQYSPVLATLPQVAGCANGAGLSGGTCSLAPGTTYYWQLTSMFSGWASSSAWTPATTAARAAPTLTAGTATTGSVTLSWPTYSPGGDQSGRYVLQRSTSSNGSKPTTVYTGAGTSFTDTGGQATTAGTLVTTATVAPLSMGRWQGCMVADASAYCWGSNGFGLLGNGTLTDSSSVVPVRGLLGHVVTQVSVGGKASADTEACALADGAVYCWGQNSYGQLGNGTTTASTVPVPVSTAGVLAGLTITQVAAGDHHACALSSAGAVYCWGSNASGQLGNGTTTGSSVPVAVGGALAGLTVIAISTGANHTCAVAGGAAYCWGSDGASQLGDGGWIDRSSPVAVVGLKGTVNAVAAGGTHTCAVTSSSAIFCWGSNTYGELGKPKGASTPVEPIGPKGDDPPLVAAVLTVAAGNDLTCATVDTGSPSLPVYCWGLNSNGQVGTSQTTTTTPVKVAGVVTTNLTPAAAVGYQNACVLTKSSGPFCWGAAAFGALGNGTTSPDQSTPVALTMPTTNLCTGYGSGVAHLDPTTCRLIAGTTRYYQVGYSIGAWAGPFSAWTKATTSSQ